MNCPAPARLIRFALLTLSLAAAFAPQCRAWGQQGGPSSIIMSNDPVALDPVGLEIQIPENATAFRADRGDIPTIEISPTLGHWFLLVQAPQRRAARPSDAQTQVGGNLRVDDLTDRVLDNLMGSYRVDQTGTETIESRARVLLRETGLTVAGRPASRFYVAFPEADRERVRMYTLVDAGAGQMVSFDLMCDPRDEREARMAYLAVLASAQFSGNTEIAAARAVALETTEALIGSLTEADYLEALDQIDGRWDRLSDASGTGLEMDDTERGYRRIRAWKGHRGEINPERSRESWSQEEQEEGYLVRMDGRMIERTLGGTWNIIDTRIICFMSPDRSKEAWTASTTFRQGEQKPIVNTEFGVRVGEEMRVARRGITSNTFQPAVPPRGYVNQVEFYLLPQLLIGQGAKASYGVYAYASGDTSVRYRQFDLEEGAGAASWQLSTELGDEARSVSLYDENAEFLGSDRGDGSRWTPSSQRDLLDLWQRKGLPTSTR